MARRTTIIDTKLEIVQVAVHLFLTEGYSNTSVSKIARELGISLGNLTFHFPTKEHLLAELIEFLCEYHILVMEQEIEEGRTTLLAYLLELASMMAICEENKIAKDLYLSAYTHSLSLVLFRKFDTLKAKSIFSEYCPDWSEQDFAVAENIVSGIEYASLCIENAEDIPLEQRMISTLNTIMELYHVPPKQRMLEIEKICNINYRRIGRRFIEGFTKYVSEECKKALDSVKETERHTGDGSVQ